MQPKRLLDAHGGPSDVTRLLRAAQRETAPADLRRTTWKALAAQTALTGIALGSTIPAAAKGAAVVGTSGAGGSLGAGTLLSKAATFATIKSLALGVGIGGGIVATYSVATHFTEPAAEQWTVPSTGSRPTASQRAQRPPKKREIPALQAPTPETPSEEPTISTATNTADVSNSTNVVPRQASPGTADAIRSEARRVSEARTLVRSGKGVDALRKLEELDVAFPAGVLRQERDALRIDALFLTGRSLEAQTLARRFSTRYPESPLAARWASRAR
jgi:hypothetical protein